MSWIWSKSSQNQPKSLILYRGHNRSAESIVLDDSEEENSESEVGGKQDQSVPPKSVPGGNGNASTPNTPSMKRSRGNVRQPPKRMRTRAQVGYIKYQPLDDEPLMEPLERAQIDFDALQESRNTIFKRQREFNAYGAVFQNQSLALVESFIEDVNKPQVKNLRQIFKMYKDYCFHQNPSVPLFPIRSSVVALWLVDDQKKVRRIGLPTAVAMVDSCRNASLPPWTSHLDFQKEFSTTMSTHPFVAALLQFHKVFTEEEWENLEPEPESSDNDDDTLPAQLSARDPSGSDTAALLFTSPKQMREHFMTRDGPDGRRLYTYEAYCILMCRTTNCTYRVRGERRGKGRWEIVQDIAHSCTLSAKIPTPKKSSPKRGGESASRSTQILRVDKETAAPASHRSIHSSPSSPNAASGSGLARNDPVFRQHAPSPTKEAISSDEYARSNELSITPSRGFLRGRVDSPSPQPTVRAAAASIAGSASNQTPSGPFSSKALNQSLHSPSTPSSSTFLNQASNLPSTPVSVDSSTPVAFSGISSTSTAQAPVDFQAHLYSYLTKYLCEGFTDVLIENGVEDDRHLKFYGAPENIASLEGVIEFLRGQKKGDGKSLLPFFKEDLLKRAFREYASER
ncbi:hypothetical protein T439DRAFT_376706 [Meredithblackwellia eburnea MCA 4105]